MGGPYVTTHMISSQCRMLSWPYGSTHIQQMTTWTMTCAPLEKIHGVGFRGTWKRKHLIMSMHIPCLVLLLMQSTQWWRSVATLSPWWHSEQKRGHKCTYLATGNKRDSFWPTDSCHIQSRMSSKSMALLQGSTANKLAKSWTKIGNAMLTERAQISQEREERT